MKIMNRAMLNRSIEMMRALMKGWIISTLILFFLMIAERGLAQNSDKQSSWMVSTTDTGSNYTPAYLGNGILGLRSDRTGLRPESVHINGLYDRSPDRDNARLINEYNPLQIDVLLNDGRHVQMDNNITGWRQILNMKEAVLSTNSCI